MIITKTPFRISFFGGGTDFPSYFLENGGKVLSTTIDKYCYVNVRRLPRFFEYNDEIIYSKIEQVKNVDEIIHPMVRNVIKYLGLENIKISYDADLPARTGLGTSSSFAVGLLNALHILRKDNKDKKKLADEAIYVERVLCNEAGGVQDQIAASFGNLNIINFNKDDKHVKDTDYNYDVEEIKISKEKKEKLNENLLLYFTGISRNSFEVQSKTEKSLEEKKKELKIMSDLVDNAKYILENNNSLDDFGLLLDETWKLKRSLSKGITTDYIDEIYEKAKSAGALGGKLLGAGGGGFVLFYVADKKKEEVKNALKDLMNVPFKFDEEGTKVIYVEK